MRFLIAIPNYSKQLSDLRMLNRCIKSLLQHEPMIEKDIWIFDDASPYFDDDLVFHKRVIKHDVNQGYSAMVNDAFKFAKNYSYSAIVTLNSDVEITRPFLNRALNVFRFDPEIAVIGGLLTYPSGRIQSAGFSVDENGNPIEFNKNKFLIHSDHDALMPRYLFGVTGALQIIRREALADIGVYDMRFKLSYEDVEFCYRTWMKKHRVFYDPHIQAVHAESASRGYFVGPKELQSYQQWIKCFSKKNLAAIQTRVDALNLSSQSQVGARSHVLKLIPEARSDDSKQSL